MRDGKLFGKISIVDIVAVLLIAVLAVGLYQRFVSGKDMNTTPQKFEYVLLIEGVRIESVNALKKGGFVMDGKSRERMGAIKEVDGVAQVAETTPAVNSRREMMDDGRFVKAEQVGKYDVRVTVTVDGKKSANGYYTPLNKQINVGSRLVVETTYVKTSAIIESLEVKD